jgi:hypothetical protein
MFVYPNFGTISNKTKSETIILPTSKTDTDSSTLTAITREAIKESLLKVYGNTKESLLRSYGNASSPNARVRLSVGPSYHVELRLRKAAPCTYA